MSELERLLNQSLQREKESQKKLLDERAIYENSLKQQNEKYLQKLEEMKMNFLKTLKLQSQDYKKNLQTIIQNNIGSLQKLSSDYEKVLESNKISNRKTQENQVVLLKRLTKLENLLKEEQSYEGLEEQLNDLQTEWQQVLKHLN